MTSKTNTECRYCGSKQLTKFLSLGQHPPSNSFIKPEDVEREERYPLEVHVCEACWLVQLLDVVPGDVIFDDYAYLSSTSNALKSHYAGLTKQVTDRFRLATDDLVVDIGCNDGILLNACGLEGLKKVGVEPSNVADIARKRGFTVYKEFFSVDTAEQIVADHGSAKVVTATNVFAHVDDISGFTRGVPRLLAVDGIFIIEASYLIDLIDQTLFDTIYHEHLCYYSLTPMVPFFERHGLEIFDAERVDFGASGPAIRVYTQKAGGPHRHAPRVKQLLEFEASWGVKNLEKYLSYARNVKQMKKEPK